MNNKDENRKVDKIAINWLIPIYSNFSKLPLFVRFFED